jgi:sulfate permease, SulP family
MDHRGRVLGALSGGVSVAAAGLPPAIALGALSATPLGSQALASGVVAALIAAIFGRVCAAFISRTPGEISAPDAALSIVYASLCADLITQGGPQLAVGEVIAALSLAVVLMGVLQLLAGWARLGEALKFLPYPVSAGIVTGTGLLVMWAQLGPMIGLEGRLTSYDWVSLVQGFKPLALLIGVASALGVWFAPKRIQPLLAGLALGIVLYHVIAAFAERGAAGPTLEAMSAFSATHERVAGFWGRVGPAWLLDTSLQVLPYSALLALEGMIELAHTSHAIAEITGVQPDIHRSLVAQGAANVLCGVLAALPIAPSHSQSSAAARMGESRSLIPGVSAAALFIAATALAGLLAFVPAAALAGLLVTVGVGLIDRWTRGLVRRAARGGDAQAEIKGNLAIVAVVAGAFFFGGVPLALLVGTVLAMVMLAHSLSAATSFLPEEGASFASTRIWPAEQAAWLPQARSVIRVLRPRGGLFFGTADQLAKQLGALDTTVRYCIIDCSRLTVLDATGCHIVAASARRLAGRGVTTVLAGLDPAHPRDRDFVALGLDTPSPQDRWFRDLDHALEWVEAELLRERWPEVAADEAIELARTHLAKGLPRAELEVLRAHLGVTDVEAGKVLFERGAVGDALYAISQGLIEIRVATDAPGGHSRRLAVFGPGCIFGEIAMLTRGPRTADAVCVKPARLYELRHDALLELEGLFPMIHAKLIANLNLNLMTRLIVATEIARGR